MAWNRLTYNYITGICNLSMTADIAINKAEIAVLNAKVTEIKSRSDNPLSQ